MVEKLEKMEIESNYNENGLQITINFDELLDDYCPEICDALLRRRRILNEIKDLASRHKDIDNMIISAVTNSADFDDGVSAIMENCGLSREAAEFVMNGPIRNPRWNYKERLSQLEEAIASLKK